MTLTINSVVLRAPNDPFSLERVRMAEPGPSQVLVKIAGTGLCHTDLRTRDPEVWNVTGPIIPGHEGAGIVTKVGSAVTDLHPGDAVIMSFASCGRCTNCLRGSPGYCDHFEAMNLTGLSQGNRPPAEAVSDGLPLADRWFGQSSFAEYAVVEDRAAVRVDAGLPLALLAPLACSVQTGVGSVFHEMDVRPGHSVAVFGVGAVGLAGVVAAKLCGATEIVAVDRDAHRLSLARELGATRTVEGGDDLDDRVRAGGPGMHWTLETTAAPPLLTAAIQVLRRPGGAVLVGAGGRLSVTPRALAGRRVTFCFEGSAVPQVFIPQLVAMWQRGDLPLEKIVECYDLSDINRAEADMASGRVVKPVLVPSTGAH
ncbi:alcohol dehydrogenase catalytic domain-containing protein [Microbacterium lacus]|uniref:NAD(P)-dependent alcohol dehydrogenase n=1 Tax=Microbacterium lacus TaxID=415217 RepID=A0ABP4TE84_9MICO